MADSEHRERGNPKELTPRSARDKLFRLLWTSLRGWLVVVVILLLAKAIGRIYSQVADWLDPLSSSLGSPVSSIALVFAGLIVGPWLLGRVVELLLVGRFFQRQRGMRAFQRMERRLSSEFSPDESRGYRVALINFPNSEIRSLALMVAEFSEPGT